MADKINSKERISTLRDSATYLEREDPQAYWDGKPVWDLARVTARSQAENLRLFAELLERVGQLEAEKAKNSQHQNLIEICKLAERILHSTKTDPSYSFSVTSLDFGELDFRLAQLETKVGQLETKKASDLQTRNLIAVCRAAEGVSDSFVANQPTFHRVPLS